MEKTHSIFDEKRAKNLKLAQERQRECDELESKLKYLVNNPIAKNENIERIDRFFPLLFDAKSYYSNCANVNNFINQHNASESQIKFYKHKRYISVNRITTHINLQDETITYILHKTH